MTTTPDSDQRATGVPVLRGIAAHLGIIVLGTYAVGFLVANAYYGDLWVIDPSLLQTRYAAAGALWFLFTAATLVPSYYLSYFWHHLASKRTSADQSAESHLPLPLTPRWVQRRGPVLRGFWLLLSGLPLLLFVLLSLAIFVVTPFFAFVLLFTLGASPVELVPALQAFT